MRSAAGVQQEERLARSADEAILRRAAPGYVAHPIIALIFFFGAGFHREHAQLTTGFLAVSVAISLARLAFHFAGGGLRDRNVRLWRLAFAVGMVASTVSWTAFVCYVLAARGVDRATFFLLLCSAGLSAGATNTLSPKLGLIRLYLVLSISPVILFALLSDDTLSLPLAAILGFLLIFHILEARRLYDERRQMLLAELLLEERQRANEHLVQAVDHAAEPIALLDADGSVEHANPAYERAGADRLLAAIAGVGAAELDGRSYEATVSPVGDGRRVLVARDVTDRNRAESERQQMREQLVLAERLASMGTLAAGVAHEINNPLAYVAGNVELVAMHLPTFSGDPELLEEARAALSDAAEGAERVRRIVQDLKQFSRADVTRRPVDLIAVIDLAAKMAAAEIRPRARLVKDYRPIPLVDGEESQLGQVFLGLLVNAAQSIDEGKPGANEIRIVTYNDAGHVMVDIRDTGAGIPPDIRNRIFEPFFTTKPIGVGTGLGLSICHGIVKALGGEVTVVSEVGRGSTFRVKLQPATGYISEQVPAILFAPAGKATILVVDDEPKIGAIVKRTLAPTYDIVVETAAQAVLARLRAGEHYDALLCDLMMPDLTGMDLYDQLADVAPELRERTIFLTGGAFTPRARAFLAKVKNPRIDKPFDRETLSQGLARILGPTKTPPIPE